MLFRGENPFTPNLKYIFCTANNKPHLSRKDPAQRLGHEELKEAIHHGTNTRKAVFAVRLIELESNAIALGKSWSYYSHIKDNYWVIALKMSDREYEKHRRKFFGTYQNIGSYLNPLKSNIVYYKNANNEQFSLEKDSFQQCCAIL